MGPHLCFSSRARSTLALSSALIDPPRLRRALEWPLEVARAKRRVIYRKKSEEQRKTEASTEAEEA